MALLLDPVNLLALLTLTLLEIVLGIDNVIFIAITTNALPEEKRGLARRLGLGLALGGRVAMVLGVSWLLSLEHPLFSVFGREIGVSDLIIIAIAIAVMMFYSGPVAEFINGHVSVKLQALAFLVLIAVMLILEGVGEPIDRTIVYVAILFAVGVEYLNYRRRRNLERRGGGVIPGQEGV